MADLRRLLRETAPTGAPVDLDAIQRRVGQRHRRRLAVAIATPTMAIVIVVALAVSFLGGPSSSEQSVRVDAPGVRITATPATFVAVMVARATGDDELVRLSATSGRIVSVIRTFGAGQSDVHGLAVGRDGSVWLTFNSGPKCGGDILGCGPKPDSCASRVIRIDPGSNQENTVLIGGDNEQITDAAPSPDGRQLVYVTSGCATGFDDDWLAVRTLSTGRTFTIGASLARCHQLQEPVWTSDGHHLVVLYGAARGPLYRGPQGSCSSSWAPTMTIVGVAASPGLPGRSVPLPKSCHVAGAAPTRIGYQAVEACGTQGGVEGTVRLYRFDRQLRQVGQAHLGRCDNSATMATDPTGRSVLIATTQYCATSHQRAIEVLDRIDANSPPRRLPASQLTQSNTQIAW